MLMKLRSQRGIGLLELMLSLGIIAILLVMATRYFITASRSEQVNRATSQVNALVAAINNWKNGNTAGSYAGLTAEELNKFGLIPPAEYDGTNIMSPFQTTVGVAPTDNNEDYEITYAGIPDWACESLAAKFRSNGADATCTSGTFTYKGSLR